jgi:acetyltransferase-like isoleucine patch superfamily enzyme
VTGHAVLERGVFLGSHASITPGVRVGAFAVVGAGSVAFRNVRSGQTLLGVPGKSLLS